MKETKKKNNGVSFCQFTQKRSCKTNTLPVIILKLHVRIPSPNLNLFTTDIWTLTSKRFTIIYTVSRLKMGNTIERKIMFVGLSGAGSTQLLYSLKLLRSPDVSFKPSNGTREVISTRLQCAFDEFSSSRRFQLRSDRLFRQRYDDEKIQVTYI